MFREEIETIFGEQALALGLFYKVEQSLRFELSLGGSYIDQFSTAYDRGRKVLARAFEDAERFIFVFSNFGGSSSQFSRSTLRSLNNCGIHVSRPYEYWSVSERTFIAFEGKREQVIYALWGALASDLGIRPRLTCRVHIAAPEIGVLTHPYDDRGMDIIGSNLPRLKSLYNEFNRWLLDYDREKMDKTISAL